MNPILKAKNILFQPNNCWSDFEKEKGIGNALSYLIILLIVGAVLYYSIGLISLGSTSSEQVNKISAMGDKFGLSIQSTLLAVTIILFVIFFIATFINSGLIHLFIKMFKGQGTFSDSYKAFTYGTTPQLLLMGIPFINQFSYFYMIYLQLNGLSKLHKISIWKAVFAYILADLILLIAIFGPIFIFIISKIV
jgi:hypothetical protein